ncbi:nmrA-like family protein [Sarocladium implicatum]|nr:nmrA-like family protein [Sarocladium implicatum]
MKLLVVLGATGQQGSSVISHVQSDEALSQTYTIRAITRDATSVKAKSFGPNVEVVQADVEDQASLEAALRGADTVFAMTTPSFGEDGVNEEFQRAKLIADASVTSKVNLLIFSTLPGVTKLSGGRYTAVTAFDAKAKAEEYIRQLPLRSAFVAPASFMENLANPGYPQAPKKQPDGTWSIRLPMPAETRSPWIATKEDFGKYVGAMLKGSRAEGDRAVCAAVDSYSWTEIVEKISKHTGQRVVYEEVSKEQFRQIQTFATEVFLDVLLFYKDPGYFGPDTESLVATDSQFPLQPLTTLDEWLASVGKTML